MSKRPKLAHDQRTAANSYNREEETPSVVEYEYTGRDHRNDIPKNVTHLRIHPSVTEIEDYAFHGKLRLKEVVLNDGLWVIGSDAFAYCTSLHKISIPSTVTKIDYSAFGSCTGLKEVVFNEGLMCIEGGAFRECKSLQSVRIPSTVTEIGRNAFNSCNSLRELVFNDGLKKIGDRSFESCTDYKVSRFHLQFMRLKMVHLKIVQIYERLY